MGEVVGWSEASAHDTSLTHEIINIKALYQPTFRFIFKAALSLIVANKTNR